MEYLARALNLKDLHCKIMRNSAQLISSHLADTTYLQFVTKLLGSRYFRFKWQASQCKISLVNRQIYANIFVKFIGYEYLRVSPGNVKCIKVK